MSAQVQMQATITKLQMQATDTKLQMQAAKTKLQMLTSCQKPAKETPQIRGVLWAQKCSKLEPRQHC